MNRLGRSHLVTSPVVREVLRIVRADGAFCHLDKVDPLGNFADAERMIEAVAALSLAALEERRKLTNQLVRTAIELALMAGYLERSDDGAERPSIAMEIGGL